MVWYLLLVFILLSHVDSSKDNNQICGGIPFVNLSPLISELYSNFRPDYNQDHIVSSLLPESRAPESGSSAFAPLVACSTRTSDQTSSDYPSLTLSIGNRVTRGTLRTDHIENRAVQVPSPENQALETVFFSNQPGCQITANPISQLVACFTHNCDQTSSDIPSLTLSIGNSVTRDTLQTDHIENPAVQVLSPQSQALETVSFPLFSGNFLLSNQPDWQGTTNPILPGVASPTGNKDRIFREISAIDVSTGNSVQCVILGPSNTEERAVQVLSPQSLAPGSDSFQFFQAGQLQQNHQECPSTANPPSQFLGCSTGNSDHSPKCIPVFQLSPAKKFYDTCRPDNIADLSGQFQVLENQTPGSASFALSTGGIPSNKPVGQVSSSQRWTTGNGSTLNSDQSYQGGSNVIWFSNNDFDSEDILPISKKRKKDRLSFGELQSVLRSYLAFAVNWPTPKFVRPDAVIRKVSEKPLFALEVFFNSRRNTQTQTMISYAVRNDVVIAIDNYLQECRFLFPHTLRVMTAETRQIAEYIVGHDDKNLISCFSFASLSRHQQQKLVRSAPMSFKMVFPPSVAGILATMSIVFRSANSYGYHYPTLKLFWNASVKLLELHGANGQDFIYCLKLHIMDKSAFEKPSNRRKLDWNRNESIGNCLNMHLSIVLSGIADELVKAFNDRTRNKKFLNIQRIRTDRRPKADKKD